MLCSRSFRDGKDISVQVSGEGPTKNKRPVTICLAQCNKSKKSPSLTPSLIAICASPVGQMSPSSSSDGPTRIDEYIYLGSQTDASSESTIKRCGITHVLNVTTTCPRCPYVSEGNFLRVSVNDGHYDQLLPYFNDVFQFIDDAAQTGGSVLIHCMAGVSRSATLVIAYLMHRSKLSFNEAYRFVKQKRPNVAPNFNFLGQLMEFETYLRLQQRSHESSHPTIAQSLSPSQASNHGAFASTPVEELGSFVKAQELSTPQRETDNRSFKCLQYSTQDGPSTLKMDSSSSSSSRLSPSDEFISDLRYRCRTNSINQSGGSPSSLGSHESAEILQVS